MFNIKNSILAKILLIFTIFLLFFNVCSCFAVENNNETPIVTFYDKISDKNITLSLPQGYGINYNYFFVTHRHSVSGSASFDFFVVLVSSTPMFIDVSGGGFFVRSEFTDSYFFGYYNYIVSNNSVDYSTLDFSDLTISDFTPIKTGSYSSTSVKLDYITVSSHPLYDFNDRDSVIYDSSISLPEPVVKNPYFITSQEELVDGNIEKLVISSGGYSDLDDTIYLQSMYYPENVSEEESYNSLFPRKEISLNGPNSPYYVGVNDSNEFIYEIPRSDLGIDLVEGNKYAFHLGIRDENNLFERLARLDFTVGVVNPEDVTNDKIDQQTDAIQENTETQKGIWDTIKEVLSYINPFSENFFVYKLLELLFDGIKALIIPSDGFFEEYFSSLNDWFSDRLGFLYYPIELLIDILGRYSSLSSSNLSFTIPDIPEPFNDEVLIESTTFNFNSILSNSTYKQVHDYYLLFVDFIIAFGLIKLAIKKWEEVTSN